jgi:hypothetical protein
VVRKGYYDLTFWIKRALGCDGNITGDHKAGQSCVLLFVTVW